MEHEPRRTLGLAAAVSMVIGTVIGSGIFLVTSQMMRAVGSPARVLAVWVFGGVLTLTAVAAAPFVSEFYHEPRLLPMMDVIAIAFTLTGAGIQHGVLLTRRMRKGPGCLSRDGSPSSRASRTFVRACTATAHA